MTTFIEQRLLDRVAYGSEFGHGFRTRIVELKSGRERRNAEWQMPRGRYSVLYDRLEHEHHALVIAAHRACMGALVGFRFRDWSDYAAQDEPLGEATGEEQTLQLTRHYSFGALEAVREIHKPVVGSVTVTADGEPVTGASVDYTTGEVTLTAPEGAALAWSGEFDVPVRFESDDISSSIDHRSQHGLLLTADVGLLEVRL